jgi:transcription termination factor Rho
LQELDQQQSSLAENNPRLNSLYERQNSKRDAREQQPIKDRRGDRSGPPDRYNNKQPESGEFVDRQGGVGGGGRRDRDDGKRDRDDGRRDRDDGRRDRDDGRRDRDDERRERDDGRRDRDDGRQPANNKQRTFERGDLRHSLRERRAARKRSYDKLLQ